MTYTDMLLSGYEDTKLVHYEDMGLDFPNTYRYDDLPDHAVNGVLKANRYINGKLVQTYSQQENHVGVIAATRLGKTTSYVIPTILSFARQKVKRSLIISDPKGELYRTVSKTLAAEGYKVKLLNFRDYLHSECWNPLTPIYRHYMQVLHLEEEVETVKTDEGERYKFRRHTYADKAELDKAVQKFRKIETENVANEVDLIAIQMITNERTDDPYWEDCARDLLKAGIWAMLEDITPRTGNEPITEETFSFRTLLSLFDSMHDERNNNYNDGGYFTHRTEYNSRAYTLAKNCLLENAPNTRKCIMSCFNSRMSVYKDGEVRLITSCNSFEMSELTENGPIAIFISYRDEIKSHYRVISAFIQSAYAYLIKYANGKRSGKLDIPFYFVLDEFGNFPAITDFETVIAACAGRNIFFILILQSYAQLNNVYGQNVSEIIRDNLNVHVFIGSNNPLTLSEFSQECGERARIAPVSALNGSKGEMENFSIETIALMPKSRLASLAVGECIVTEANCGYVMLSKLERYYLCREFQFLPEAAEMDYVCQCDPLDDCYNYTLPEADDDDLFDF